MNFHLDDRPMCRLDAVRTLEPQTDIRDQGMGHRGKLALLRRLVPALLGIVISVAVLATGSAHAQVGSARYSAIIIDARTGKIIMGVNQDEPRFPASLTKLMTLYMTFEALRDRRVQLGQYVPVSAWAAEQPPSKLGLQPGEALTVEQAILGIVTKSGNDAAAALGEFLGGSEDRFAQMMTLRARALGMSRTSFRNASGLPDSNQWTTARDLATLGRRLVLDFPQLYGYFGVSGFVWHNRVIPNHDTMLRSYPGADGMKTGFTDYAGHNLETSAVRGGVRLIGVVMGAASNTERDQHMTMLLDDGFNQMNVGPNRFGGGLFSLANAATTYSERAPQPRQEPEVTAMAPRIPHDRAVQVGAFPAERAAWIVAEQSAHLAPDGQPRVQPIIFRRRTLYHAQLLGLSETEARTVCAALYRRVPACQVFRMGAGQTALR
jgi:D-alanyl-D-alanine carboxypeptidase